MFVPEKPKEKSNENILDEKTIKSIKEEIEETNLTEFIPANQRNVIFCGASRSGKTTIFEVLQNPTYCPKNIQIFAETRTTSFKTFSIRNKKDSTVYNFVLNLIDTPGTFEVRSTKDQFEKMSNEEISNIILECLNNEVTYLNLLVLVINCLKFSQTEIDSIELFVKLFGESKIPIILCLTHADGLTEKTREAFEQQLVEYPGLSTYFEKKLFKIMWAGCVNHVQKQYINEDSMRNDYDFICYWRYLIINEILKAEERIPLKKTDIYKIKQKESEVLLIKCQEDIQKIINFNNHDVDSNEKLVENHTKNMNELFKLINYISKSENGRLFNLYNDFHVNVNKLKNSNLSTQNKQKILGNWFDKKVYEETQSLKETNNIIDTKKTSIFGIMNEELLNKDKNKNK